MVKGRRGRRVERVVAAALTALTALPSLAAPQPPAPDARTPDAKAEAVARFDMGLALYDKGAWAAALAEFLEARRLYPLRNAGFQAALCLQKLERHDEALDLLEGVLRDFGDTMPPAARERVQRHVLEARARVGTIEIDDADPGARVTVDGRGRGEYPLLSALRVTAGSHVVRVYKEGFEPFEARVEVAGGRSARVSARLSVLLVRARLRVVERDGGVLDVVVDGNVVGKTPWEGPVSPGEHTVLLRGGEVGTQPISVSAPVGRLTPVTLTAEYLGAWLRVEPTPAGASVAVDLVTAGQGVWEWNLRAGAHTIEVSAPGFLAASERVTLARGANPILRVVLQRDPRSSFAPRRSRVVLDVTVAAAFAPVFGGEVAGGCRDACTQSPGMGGYAAFRGGYELGMGLGFGLTAGYFAAAQSIRGRGTSVTPVGRAPEVVTAQDALWIHAGLAGAWAGFSFGARVPIHLRLGAGGIFGAATDTRTVVSDRARVPVTGERHPLYGIYLAPEVRVGLALGRHVEIGAGVELLFALLPGAPLWSSAHPVILDRGRGYREYGAFPGESIAGPIVAIAPGISVRYEL